MIIKENKNINNVKICRSQFIDDVRKVMGIPEWFLHIDSRTTQNLHGGACVAFKLHFKGPKAHQLEQDFSKLVATGRLDEPTLFIPGYYNPKRKKRIGYRTCSVRDPSDKDSEIIEESKRNFFLIEL